MAWPISTGLSCACCTQHARKQRRSRQPTADPLPHRRYPSNWTEKPLFTHVEPFCGTEMRNNGIFNGFLPVKYLAILFCQRLWRRSVWVLSAFPPDDSFGERQAPPGDLGRCLLLPHGACTGTSTAAGRTCDSGDGGHTPYFCREPHANATVRRVSSFPLPVGRITPIWLDNG